MTPVINTQSLSVGVLVLVASSESRFGDPFIQPDERVSTRFRDGAVQGKERPEYQTWRLMKDRCFNPNNPCYDRYGGRGITVCPQWRGFDGFQQFYRDLGPRPEGKYPSGIALYSIHRKDNDGSYTPENCKWALKSEQNANRNVQSRKAKEYIM